MTANQISLEAFGSGGAGRVGGNGTGGAATALGSLGGTVSMTQFNAFATGFGGSSGFSAGGLGLGGEAAVELQGISVTVSGNTTVEANGGGGFALTGRTTLAGRLARTGPLALRLCGQLLALAPAVALPLPPVLARLRRCGCSACANRW